MISRHESDVPGCSGRVRRVAVPRCEPSGSDPGSAGVTEVGWDSKSQALTAIFEMRRQKFGPSRAFRGTMASLKELARDREHHAAVIRLY